MKNPYVRDKMKREKSITGSFLEGIPIFGNFLKDMAKTGTFQKRFKETDEQIKENLRKGKRGVEIKGGVSVRPIKKDTPRINIEDLR